MEKLEVFFFLILIAAFYPLHKASGAVANPIEVKRVLEVHNQKLNNVVRIRAIGKNGFGFIFGRVGDIVWVATAAHVVFPDYGDVTKARPEPAAQIMVQRNNDSRWWTPYDRPELTNVEDLALIPISMPRTELSLWRESVVEAHAESGDLVWLAGTTKGIEYGEDGARITSLTAEGDAQVAGIIGGEGQSGVPVATVRGFIGLYTQSAGQRFIPIRRIRDAAKAANRPWDLTEVPMRSIAVQLCVAVNGKMPELLRINGPRGIVPFDKTGCVLTGSGENIIVSDTPHVECTPSKLSLRASSKQKVVLHCNVTPVGVWNGPAGFLEVTSDGIDRWLLKEGLLSSPYGWIAGELTGNPPRLWIRARTQSGNAVSGNLTVEPKRLFGRLSVDGVSWNLDLTR